MAGERRAPVWAMALSLPACTWGVAENIMSITTCELPAITSSIAGALPLKGMCVILMPASALRYSVPRCVDEPLPADEKLSSPGLALARAIRSLRLWMPRFGLTISSAGPLVSSVTGTRSLRMS